MSRHSPKEVERIKRIAAGEDFGKPVAQGSFAAPSGSGTGRNTRLTMRTSTHTVSGMNTTPTLANKIRNIVPPQVEAALLRRRGKYTDMVDIFHCIQLHTDQWVGVAGDGANGSYEHFSLKDGVLDCSDCGWGSTDIALLEVLTKEVMR